MGDQRDGGMGGGLKGRYGGQGMRDPRSGGFPVNRIKTSFGQFFSPSCFLDHSHFFKRRTARKIIVWGLRIKIADCKKISKSLHTDFFDTVSDHQSPPTPHNGHCLPPTPPKKQRCPPPSQEPCKW